MNSPCNFDNGRVMGNLGASKALKKFVRKSKETGLAKKLVQVAAVVVNIIPGAGQAASVALFAAAKAMPGATGKKPVAQLAADIATAAQPGSSAPLVQDAGRGIDSPAVSPVMGNIISGNISGWGAKEWIITGTGLVVLSGLTYIVIKRFQKRK